MKATELRIGNLIEYKIEDKLDERKEWWKVSKVDFQDLTWLDSNPEDSDFRPIKITEEWLLKFGFVKKEIGYSKLTEMEQCFLISFGKHTSVNGIKFNNEIKTVHQLQNLYFALTGEELTQVSEGENKNFV